MQLGQLVATSQRVAATRARLQKIAALADCIALMSPDEIEIGVAYVAGDLCQGRIGIGYATLRELGRDRAAASLQLGLREVDAAFSRIAGLSGPGSAGERVRQLEALLARATRDEQAFLRRYGFWRALWIFNRKRPPDE